MSRYLRVQGRSIVDRAGKPVFLRGVNLGGWLLMEGYFMHAPNRGESIFKKQFRQKLGLSALKDFECRFRSNFIREDDIRRIARWGFNCIRVPFHYRLIEHKPYRYSREGFSYLDKLVDWARKHKLAVILDLHAACGAQSTDWHADSDGRRAGLWESPVCRRRTYALWRAIARRYKDEPAVAGYDLLNEAVTDDTAQLNRFYRETIAAIREVDRNHIVFVEANKWAMDLDCLERFDDDNLCLSIHAYQPLDMTFNFVPGLRYPLRGKQGRWDKSTMRRYYKRYARIAQRHAAPVFVGEFGVNARGNACGETDWLKDVLAVFKELDFHWAYWTYKAVKNSVFPDGIISYRPNPPWVHRQGPKTGWENYAELWPAYKNDMIRSWRSDGFQENTDIRQALVRGR